MTALRKAVRDAVVQHIAAGGALPLSPTVRADNEAAVFKRRAAASTPLALIMSGQVRRARADRGGRWGAEVDVTAIVFAGAQRGDTASLDALDELLEALESRMRAAAPEGFLAVGSVDGDPFDPGSLQQDKTYVGSVTVTYRKAAL